MAHGWPAATGLGWVTPPGTSPFPLPFIWPFPSRTPHPQVRPCGWGTTHAAKANDDVDAMENQLKRGGACVRACVRAGRGVCVWGGG